jgi:hypothetical protein
MLFGQHAVRVPVQLMMQPAGLIDSGNGEVSGMSGVILAAGDLSYGSQLTHQLIIGEAIVRPHAVVETDAFKGHGLASLCTMTLDCWLREGRVLLNPAGRKLGHE